MAKGVRGRYLGTATEARRIADDILKGEKDVKFPPGRNRALVHFEKEYAAVVRLLALRKIEKLLMSNVVVNGPDMIAILEGVQRHEDWAIERMKVKKGRKPKKEKEPEAAKPGTPEVAAAEGEDAVTDDAPEKVMETPPVPVKPEGDLKNLDDMKKAATV